MFVGGFGFEDSNKKGGQVVRTVLRSSWHNNVCLCIRYRKDFQTTYSKKLLKDHQEPCRVTPVGACEKWNLGAMYFSKDGIITA
ncbi:hypothetical protein BVC80_8921g27 [Macleaya cordata]|uniref:Uncharacterized protein n=1 Tax=Macleaya cordata TaxID=56857 RepID=A0A200PWB5_MACCD|nr:hypothetical protein BVC80_8921g27 [Macleaya cordata]